VQVRACKVKARKKQHAASVRKEWEMDVLLTWTSLPAAAGLP